MGYNIIIMKKIININNLKENLGEQING